MTDQEIIQSIAKGQERPGYLDEIWHELKFNPKTIVILDDDPTGTQTVHDIPVITQWTEEVIEKEILNSPVFFILTNSRSLLPGEADNLGRLIGRRLQKAAAKYNKNLVVISRSDSTLRGHYPNEVNALASGLGWNNAKHLLVPAFFEGGRYTYKDVHYVKEGDAFIPAAETPFAKDNTFGYASSDLKAWIAEKTKGEVKDTEVKSLSLDVLRNRPTQAIQDILNGDTNHYIANATASCDMDAIALAGLRSTARIIYRTGASFVNAIAGIQIRPLLEKDTIFTENRSNGGLIVVGSYVPKTTRQLEYLKKHSKASFIKFDVAKMIRKGSMEKELTRIGIEIDHSIQQQSNVVLYTAREVIKGDTKEESLKIVNQVSQNLIAIIKSLKNKPKYILTKGGITSSDIAVKALGVKRALVLGQAIKGVPVWRLDENAKFTELPYIVFPGNVGEDNTLFTIIQKLT